MSNRSQSDDVDLEEELLQITEKKSKKNQKKPKKSYADEEEGELSESDDDYGDEKRNNKRKSKPTDSKKPLKKRKTDEDGKGDGRYSSDESSDDEKEFNDGFDEDLMGDDADRQWLESLPEVERERILTDRYEKRKEMRERLETKRRIKAEQRAQKHADKNERERRERGNKKKDKNRKALSELKKKRAKAYKKTVSSEEEAYSSSSSKEDEDDEDYHVKSPRQEEGRHDKRATASGEVDKGRNGDWYRDRDEMEDETEGPEASLEELEQIRLSRETLEKWMDKPFFDDLVPGFFVRIGIGLDPISHANVYRVAQIEGARSGNSTYNVGQKITSKLLKLRIGNRDKEFKMETISNRQFTESEYRRWVIEMRKANISIIKSRDIPRKLEQLATANDYKYTAEDIEKMLQEKRKSGKLPVKLATEKARLIALRDAVKDEDPEEYERLCEELQKIEDAIKEKHEKIATISKVGSVATINLKNKQTNFSKSQIIDAKKEERLNSDLDPFSRRRTLPRVLFASFKKEQPPTPSAGGSSSTATAGNNSDSQAKTTDVNNNNTTNSHITINTNVDNGNTSATIPSPRKPTTPTTNPLSSSDGVPDPSKLVINEHDFVDIDIPVTPTTAPQLPFQATAPKSVPSPSTPPLSTSVSTQGSSPPSSSSRLSLADYMRRRRALE